MPRYSSFPGFGSRTSFPSFIVWGTSHVKIVLWHNPANLPKHSASVNPSSENISLAGGRAAYSAVHSLKTVVRCCRQFHSRKSFIPFSCILWKPALGSLFSMASSINHASLSKHFIRSSFNFNGPFEPHFPFRTADIDAANGLSHACRTMSVHAASEIQLGLAFRHCCCC